MESLRPTFYDKLFERLNKDSKSAIIVLLTFFLMSVSGALMMVIKWRNEDKDNFKKEIVQEIKEADKAKWEAVLSASKEVDTTLVNINKFLEKQHMKK